MSKALELADKITSPKAGPWDNLDAATELRRLAAVEAELRRLISDDGLAMSFQTLGQYRSMLLKALAAAPEPQGVPEPANWTGCACRWDKEDIRVQTCERHQGWLDVVHEWSERAKAAEQALAAHPQQTAQGVPEPARPEWFNQCDRTVPEALRYLADHERPRGGEDRFNSVHLYQLADEIERTAAHPQQSGAEQERKPLSGGACKCPTTGSDYCPVHTP